MRFNTSRALFGLACLAALGAVQAARADDAPVKLARTYKEGDLARYKSTIKTSVNGMDIVLTTVAKVTVKEVKKTGEVVVVREGEEGTLSMNGAEQPQPAEAPTTETFDKTDRLSEFKPSADSSFFDPGIAQLLEVSRHIVLPDKAVKKDDTWETELDDPAVKGKKLTLKGTFLGIEKRDGKDLWKIKQAGDALIDGAGDKMSFEYTVLLDPANGQLIHSDGTVKQLPTQVVGTIDWSEESSLQKPSDKKTASADVKKP